MAKGAAEPLTFPAAVAKVQTLSDGGIRVTLDLPESEIMALAWLAQCQRDGVVLQITAQPLFYNQEQSNGVEAGAKRKSEWAPNKGPGANCDSGKSG